MLTDTAILGKYNTFYEVEVTIPRNGVINIVIVLPYVTQAIIVWLRH